MDFEVKAYLANEQFNSDEVIAKKYVGRRQGPLDPGCLTPPPPAPLTLGELDLTFGISCVLGTRVV